MSPLQLDPLPMDGVTAVGWFFFLMYAMVGRLPLISFPQYFMLDCAMMTGSFAFQLSIIGMLNILIAQLSQALPPLYTRLALVQHMQRCSEL